MHYKQLILLSLTIVCFYVDFIEMVLLQLKNWPQNIIPTFQQFTIICNNLERCLKLKNGLSLTWPIVNLCNFMNASHIEAWWWELDILQQYKVMQIMADWRKTRQSTIYPKEVLVFGRIILVWFTLNCYQCYD